jgi:nicotinamide riboside kinase
MTVIVNLFGGPGTGKSTTAARLFSDLKALRINSELVREYVKDWAWGERRITPLNQIHFLGEQAYRESLLYGKVSAVITDSPLMLCAFYQQHYSDQSYLLDTTKAFMRHSSSLHDVRHVNIFLIRTKEYDKSGRFETEEEAIEIDKSLFNFLSSNDEIHAVVRFDEYDSILKEVLSAIRFDK